MLRKRIISIMLCISLLFTMCGIPMRTQASGEADTYLPDLYDGVSFETTNEKARGTELFSTQKSVTGPTLVTYPSEVAEQDETVGTTGVKFDVTTGGIYPGFYIHYPEGKTIPTDTALTFHAYVEVEDAGDVSYRVESAIPATGTTAKVNHAVTADCTLNAWFDITVVLKGDVTDTQWVFFNFATRDGSGNEVSIFGNKAVTIYLDNFRLLTYYENAFEFYSAGTYPQDMEGKVFAGWYQKENPRYPICSSEEFGESGAYARFVDDDVLSAKWQITKGTTSDMATTDLRLVSTVDTLFYRLAGFQVTVNGKMQPLVSNTVFERILADGEYYTPNETFGNVSKYFTVFEITQIPNSAFGTGIKVEPVWTTMDGTVVTGKTTTAVIYSGVEDEFADTLSCGEVWSAPSTVKIAKNGTYNNKGDMALSYQAVRNEYESCQLLITAEENISSFELFATDLRCGEEVLLVENTDVYVQKSINYDDYYGTGSMPDALLPMEAADAHEENVIAAGENGALWVTVYIPKETKAGVYKGEFVLAVDGASGKELVNVPVSLEVLDYTLTDERNARTLFSWRYERVAAGELDGSLEMMQYYYEFFQDYRISLQSLPLGTMSGDEYIENVEKYYDELSSYTILSSIGDISVGLLSEQNAVKEQVLSIAASSTWDRNLFEKAMIYFIDEPDIREADVRSSVVSRITSLNALLQECVDYIDADDSGTYTAFKEMTGWETAILEIPKIIPLGHLDYLVENKDVADVKEFLEAVNCLCPVYSSFTETLATDVINLLKENEIQMWWYGCTTPKAPAPTYHIGDDNLLSCRSVSWMQSKYNIEGNLYWDAAAYTDEASAYYNEYVNVYESPYRSSEYEWPAGDGFLVYPGAAYDVYGPIPSMRLMSIRDGMEEYEMLQDIEAAYEESQVASNATSEMESLFYSNLYTNGIYMNADGENGLNFMQLREKLIRFAANLSKGLDYAIANVSATTSSVSIPNLTSVVTDDTTSNTASGNTAQPTTNADGTELLLSFDSYDNITGTAIRVSKLFAETKVNKDAQYITEGTGSWMITPEGDYGRKNEYPWIRMRCTDTTFGNSDFYSYDKVMMDVYNAGDEAVSIQWKFTAYTAAGTYAATENATYVLQPHTWTTCEYDLSDAVYSSRYDLSQAVKYMTVTFLDKKASKNDTASTLYLDNLRAHKMDGERQQTTFTYSFEDGIGFETLSERFLFEASETGTAKMLLSRVAYKDTAVAEAATLFKLGEYGLQGDAGDSVWPGFSVKFDKTYAKDAVLSFWVYVETDEEAASGKTYRMEAFTERGSTAHTVQNGACEFNHWQKVKITLNEATDTLYFFVNLDGGNGVSKLGDEAVHIYMDEFLITTETESDWGEMFG